jgi:hypothetical protein
MSAEDFLSETANEENNNQVQQQEASYEEEYQADGQYGRERLTGSYTEYLRD